MLQTRPRERTGICLSGEGKCKGRCVDWKVNFCCRGCDKKLGESVFRSHDGCFECQQIEMKKDQGHPLQVNYSATDKLYMCSSRLTAASESK